jgi:hypothetical protein
MTDRSDLSDRLDELESGIDADDSMPIFRLPQSVVSAWPDYSPGDLEGSDMFTVADDSKGCE